MDWEHAREQFLLDQLCTYAQSFGPFVPGAYARGDWLTYPRGGVSGPVVWSFLEEGALIYVVDTSYGRYPPVEVLASDLGDDCPTCGKPRYRGYCILCEA